MKKKLIAGVALGTMLLAASAYGAVNKLHLAQTGTYDPAKTFLVGSSWVSGVGCPTHSKVATYPSTTPTGAYTDPACTTGDANDKQNTGLVLAKTGPTSNNAESFVELKGLSGVAPSELGYDLRTPDLSSARGSHCGASAPMFQLAMENGDVYYVGCNSPAATSQTSGNGWIRLRWGGSAPLQGYLNGTTLQPITGKIKSASIVFQEGQDTGPDNFGLAVLDNIDVNGTLIGQGPGN
ncbi:MAG TPA: hypothetical protein VHS03_08715 [Gaiellaceae bacterium]|nr:hypothetical protein [Gaiellaceae bacterium]